MYFCLTIAQKQNKMESKKNKLNTLAKFNQLLLMVKRGQTKSKEYKEYLDTVRKALAPREKMGIIESILELHSEGKTKKEIIAMGYNRSTVSRQIKEYEQGTFATNYRRNEQGELE